MKNKLQPTRTSFSRNFQCKKSPRWLSKFFHFGTENWADQLKKPPCIIVFFPVMSDHYPPANYMDYWTSLSHFDPDFVVKNSFINHLSNVEVVVRLLCHQVMNDPLNSMTIGLL